MRFSPRRKHNSSESPVFKLVESNVSEKSVDDPMKNWMLFYLNEWKWHQCLRSWPVKTKNCAARRSKKCCFPVKRNPADAILWSAAKTYVQICNFRFFFLTSITSMNQRPICFLLAVIHQPETKCLISFFASKYFSSHLKGTTKPGWDGKEWPSL